MKVVNREQQKRYAEAQANADPDLVNIEALKPEVITLTQVPTDGPPLELGPGIVAMQGDYYGEMAGQGTIVIAAESIGQAWEEVS